MAVTVIRLKFQILNKNIITFKQKKISLENMQVNHQTEVQKLVPIIQNQMKQLETSNGWEQFTDGNVKGYNKKSTDNSIITKGETTINISFEKVKQFFLKDQCFPQLHDNCVLHKILTQKKDKYKVFYVQMKTPFPLNNRDAVDIQTYINQGNKFYHGAKSCNYPFEAPDNLVRAKINIAAWIFEKIDANRTKVTLFVDMDPRGNIPEFVKGILAKQRVELLKNLQNILKKHGY